MARATFTGNSYQLQSNEVALVKVVVVVWVLILVLVEKWWLHLNLCFAAIGCGGSGGVFFVVDNKAYSVLTLTQT